MNGPSSRPTHGRAHRTRTTSTGTRSYQARHPAPHGRTTTRTFVRKRDAELWLQEQGAAHGRGDWQDPAHSKRTFAWLVQQWEQTRAVHHAPRTQARNEGLLRNYLLPAWGHVQLGAMDRPAIKGWFAKQDWTPATARKVQVVLSSVLSEGVELGVLRANPAARLKLASQPKADMTVLTAQNTRPGTGHSPTQRQAAGRPRRAHGCLHGPTRWRAVGATGPGPGPEPRPAPAARAPHADHSQWPAARARRPRPAPRAR